MPELYPNTPIIYEHPEGIAQVSQQVQIGYFFGNVILPLAMVLFVILHFRNDKNIYLYAILMGILFFTVPVWLLISSGLLLMGLDVASKWAKERSHDTH